MIWTNSKWKNAKDSRKSNWILNSPVSSRRSKKQQKVTASKDLSSTFPLRIYSFTEHQWRLQLRSSPQRVASLLSRNSRALSWTSARLRSCILKEFISTSRTSIWSLCKKIWQHSREYLLSQSNILRRSRAIWTKSILFSLRVLLHSTGRTS